MDVSDDANVITARPVHRDYGLNAELIFVCQVDQSRIDCAAGSILAIKVAGRSLKVKFCDQYQWFTNGKPRSVNPVRESQMKLVYRYHKRCGSSIKPMACQRVSALRVAVSLSKKL